MSITEVEKFPKWFRKRNSQYFLSIYMILLLFPFFPLFELPQMDFIVKRYAKFKKRTFENLDLETILLSDLPPDVNLKFQPL